MNGKDPAYSIRELVHAYGGNVVLDIPHLEIPSGQTTLLTGPNGSGKTTLLSIMALLLQPASGSIALLGHDCNGARTDGLLRRMVTLVHQKPVLFSTTVRNNVAYGLRAAGRPAREIRARVEQIIHRMGLDYLSDKQAGKLSGGEAQRVALARGLVLERPIVLLDEPTNSLDDDSRSALYDLLHEVVLRGTTVVVATHDPGIADSLEPLVIQLDRGRIRS